MSSPNPIVTKVELIRFEITVPNTTTDRAGMGVSYLPGPGTPMDRLAIRMHTDVGIVGEYVLPRARAKVTMAACEALSHALLNKPALERERHYQTMRRATKHVGEVGIGPLDVALWDIAGKHQGVSIGTMLGGYRYRLPTYASTLGGDTRPDGLSSPGAYADFAEQCLEIGYPAYKMHGWHAGDPKEEIPMLRAVSERVGDRMDIMYDSSSNLKTFADAVKVGKVCDELGFYWLEDPFADGGISINAHRRLKEHVKTPILITEFVRNAESTIDIVSAGASDFGRVDPDYDGGLTGCLKVAYACETLGMDCEVHACGPAMRQLMSALRNSNFYEMNLLHPRMTNAWSLPIYADGYSDEIDSIDADGCVEVPQGPGLGVTYDWEKINASRVDTVVVE
ncbi:MAG: mandelate racemase/muconate lactonizing protein [Chromatiales bacterium]|jgi:L-alanine-DL-glutamate epimerase-like enolase superfamily enzyme|nr:mandelate racemase/muconate lactonizing protein [Chromatiales bacterium]